MADITLHLDGDHAQNIYLTWFDDDYTTEIKFVVDDSYDSLTVLLKGKPIARLDYAGRVLELDDYDETREMFDNDIMEGVEAYENG